MATKIFVNTGSYASFIATLQSIEMDRIEAKEAAGRNDYHLALQLFRRGFMRVRRMPAGWASHEEAFEDLRVHMNKAHEVVFYRNSRGLRKEIEKLILKAIAKDPTFDGDLEEILEEHAIDCVYLGNDGIAISFLNMHCHNRMLCSVPLDEDFLLFMESLFTEKGVIPKLHTI